jgi:hypothetical protein
MSRLQERKNRVAGGWVDRRAYPAARKAISEAQAHGECTYVLAPRELLKHTDWRSPS